jgi:hypothetical protein
MTAPPAAVGSPIAPVAALSVAQHTPRRRENGPAARRFRRPVGETGPVTNAVTAGRLAGSPTALPTPQQARSTWPRMASLGALLVVLAVLALTWSAGGPRVLLGAVGAIAVVRGATVLRGARAGQVEPAAAASGAGAIWLGLVSIGVALLGLTATSWVFVAAVVLLSAVLAAALPDRRGALLAGGVAVALAAVVLGVLGGVDALLATGRTVAAVLVGGVGLANLAGAVGMARIARRPAPAPAAGCAGCACGAGGCGSLG